jgi:hypothetical protein
MSAKLTIEQMQALAQEHDGGVCLSTVYVNQSTKLRWRCSEGHEWDATANDVKNNHWCPACGGTLRGTIEQMQALAKAQGGVCLSTVYVNQSTKLRWFCAKGHEWEATPNGIKNNDHWCPACAGTLRGTIEQMEVLAKRYDGQCLSTKYVNNRTKLRWRCAKGHEWEATPNGIKNNDHWCPACGSARRASAQSLTIKQMQILAEKHDGVCLSTVYVNSYTKLRWRCVEGHEWEATPSAMKLRVKTGYWCLKCPRVAQRPVPA